MRSDVATAVAALRARQPAIVRAGDAGEVMRQVRERVPAGEVAA